MCKKKRPSPKLWRASDNDLIDKLIIMTKTKTTAKKTRGGAALAVKIPPKMSGMRVTGGNHRLGIFQGTGTNVCEPGCSAGQAKWK